MGNKSGRFTDDAPYSTLKLQENPTAQLTSQKSSSHSNHQTIPKQEEEQFENDDEEIKIPIEIKN